MKKLIILTFTLLLLVSSIVAAAPYTQSGKYYEPRYTTVICDKLPEVTQDSWDLTEFEDEKAFIYCSSDVNGWYPQGCDFTVECTDSKLGMSYGRCTEGNVCSSLSGGGIFNEGCPFSTDIHTNQFEGVTLQYSGLGFLLDSGDATIYTRSQGYGIWEFQGNGYVSTVGTCDLDKLSTATYKGDFPDQENQFTGEHILRVGFTQWIITGQTEIKSSKNIINRNGEAIYVNSPGGYRPTFEENGNIYVDVRPQSFVVDESIICNPASTICNDQGTAYITDPEGKFCDKFTGGTGGYIQKDTSTACKMICSEDSESLEFTNDCVQIKESCPASEPFFNSITGECIAVGPGGPSTSGIVNMLWWIVGGLFAIVVLIFAYAMMNRNKSTGAF